MNCCMDSRNDKQEWSIGALLTFEVQMLDLSPMDLFGMLDKQYQEASLPSLLSRHGLNMKLSYIGQPHQETEEADPGYRIQKLTAQAKIVVESTTEDSHVQPGQLDVLFIPGPPPDQKHGQQTLGFVRAHAAYGTTILTVCTGCYVAAQAGILDGRKASGPRALVSGLQRDYPKVSWDDNRRFVKDVKSDGKTSRGEIWSSGGITNGQEMVAAFIKETFPGTLSETVCAMADVGDKGELYDTPRFVETVWWIGQVIRALFQGRRR